MRDERFLILFDFGARQQRIESCRGPSRPSPRRMDGMVFLLRRITQVIDHHRDRPLHRSWRRLTMPLM